jgi:hypothetical protein
MNQRIRELAEQAGFIPGIVGLNRFTYFDPEKFAQLIIRECTSVNYHSSFQDGEFHARELLEHFGVDQ